MPSSTSSSSCAYLWVGRRWRSAALFGLGFALSLEFATRVDQALRYGAPFFGVYSYDSALFEYDEYGIRGRPGGIYEKWQLNALGLRGPEAGAQPSGDELRVVTLGASETFGLYESPDSEWPRALERDLNRRGVPSEVLNGAIAGATPAVQLRHLRYRLLALCPDVVIWVVHYSSFAGLDPARLDALAAERPEPPRPHGLAAGLSPRIPRRLREALVPRLPAAVRDLLESVRMIQLVRLRSRMGDAFGSLVSVSDGERASFEHFVANARREVQEIDASLVVVLPPRRLDERSLRLQYLSFPYVASSWLEEAMGEFAESANDAAEGVPLTVVDLRNLFGSETRDFMVDSVHFNDAGALSFAGAIATDIATDPRLPKESRRARKEHGDAARCER